MNSYEFVNQIGYGFVGSSVGYLCKQNNVKFAVYDVIPKREDAAVAVYDNIEMLVRNSERDNSVNYYFVCVPTPITPETGACNVTIVESVVAQLRQYATKKTYVLVKSTVQPGTCRKLNEAHGCEKFTVVFCPEFLVESRANLDMYEAKFALLGNHDGNTNEDLIRLFKDLYSHNPQLEIVFRKYEVCEVYKYTVNIFLATKVWFFNEIYEISEKLGFDYNEVRDLLRLDRRIGPTHTQVPGPDGMFSYNGNCFVKDYAAFNFLQQHLGIPCEATNAILDRNAELRKKKVNES
jgi:UDPglucose 6-dehydrogenase